MPACLIVVRVPRVERRHVAQLLAGDAPLVRPLRVLVAVVLLLEELAAEGARVAAHAVLPVHVPPHVLAVLAHVAADAAHVAAAVDLQDVHLA